MFQIGDYIVYGTSGVCRVEKIGPVDLPDVSKDKLYYTLSPVRNPGGHIYTPVDNQRVVMRPILTEDETEQLLKALPDIAPLTISDEKTVELLYKHSLSSCDSVRWVQVIKTIHQRKQSRLKAGKKITAVDDRYMRIAKDNLYGELAVALHKKPDEISSYIRERAGGSAEAAQ